MDHESAARAHAAEKYMLGELPPAERDDFEEHLADCSRCMDEVVAADIFAANARGVFEDQRAEAAAPKPKRWFDFILHPAPALAFSGILNVALLAFLGYGVLRVAPSLESRIRQADSPGTSRTFVVQGSSRGPAEPFVVSAADLYAVFRFDLPQQYGAYSYSMEGAAGRLRRSGTLRVSPGSETVSLTIPVTRLEPGDYSIHVLGSAGARAQEISSWMLRVVP